jgi:hypothetical protein
MSERVQIAAIRPEADDEEVAAIVSAIELAWPAAAGEPATDAAPSRWRFSGRWWSRPVPLRRDRPW